MSADATVCARPPGMARSRHFTATRYVVNAAQTRTLLGRHRKLGFWLPPGDQRVNAPTWALAG